MRQILSFPLFFAPLHILDPPESDSGRSASLTFRACKGAAAAAAAAAAVCCVFGPLVDSARFEAASHLLLLYSSRSEEAREELREAELTSGCAARFVSAYMSEIQRSEIRRATTTVHYVPQQVERLDYLLRPPPIP